VFFNENTSYRLIEKRHVDVHSVLKYTRKNNFPQYCYKLIKFVVLWHCLPANRDFQNRKSGWSTKFVLLIWKIKHDNRAFQRGGQRGQFAPGPQFKGAPKFEKLKKKIRNVF
jgi:hypothetical protein